MVFVVHSHESWLHFVSALCASGTWQGIAALACDIYQRTSPKGLVPSAPLLQMPIIEDLLAEDCSVIPELDQKVETACSDHVDPVLCPFLPSDCGDAVTSVGVQQSRVAVLSPDVEGETERPT